jgi:inosose dehydratase
MQQKTDAELGVQADSLNRMGRALAQNGFELRVHHHTPQLAENAREWRHILHHTSPEYVPNVAQSTPFCNIRVQVNK